MNEMERSGTHPFYRGLRSVRRAWRDARIAYIERTEDALETGGALRIYCVLRTLYELDIRRWSKEPSHTQNQRYMKAQVSKLHAHTSLTKRGKLSPVLTAASPSSSTRFSQITKYRRRVGQKEGK